ncbi:MAG: hypothetical protein SP1CHLAM54_03150 [Chlamydiia bacterium]|nr:hypothetical protein [Chlamydiia bacterium]MCH9615231.1 hypothetical protein [Chlamydiia bacterium]MCH9628447.1 hypothetical protein [Chlamydiia bacterium]
MAVDLNIKDTALVADYLQDRGLSPDAAGVLAEKITTTIRHGDLGLLTAGAYNEAITALQGTVSAISGATELEQKIAMLASSRVEIWEQSNVVSHDLDWGLMGFVPSHPHHLV